MRERQTLFERMKERRRERNKVLQRKGETIGITEKGGF